MRKIYLVISFVVLLLVSFLGITYSYEYNGDSLLSFELIGNYEVVLRVGEPYIEYGVKVYEDDNDISDLVYIDSSMLDINKVGNYKVRYEVIKDGVNEYIYRIVNVIDDVKPEIILKGENIVYLKLGEDYIEPGFEVVDNSDIDLKNEVVITSNLNIFQIGEYEIKYRVIDDGGNEFEIVRKIIVY